MAESPSAVYLPTFTSPNSVVCNARFQSQLRVNCRGITLPDAVSRALLRTTWRECDFLTTSRQLFVYFPGRSLPISGSTEKHFRGNLTQQSVLWHHKESGKFTAYGRQVLVDLIKGAQRKCAIANVEYELVSPTHTRIRRQAIGRKGVAKKNTRGLLFSVALTDLKPTTVMVVDLRCLVAQPRKGLVIGIACMAASEECVLWRMAAIVTKKTHSN